MTFIIILGVLLLIYVIGKYIAAKNKDLRNHNTAQFGDFLSQGAKNVGCIVVAVIVLIFLGGVIVLMQALGY